ncbi:hypothetical protein HDU97_010139 [Phlyctochytrium planicorne]|nr:hypothetical protein HDU97_010139 [Phlyctochytrium planicorne]
MGGVLLLAFVVLAASGVLAGKNVPFFPWTPDNIDLLQCVFKADLQPGYNLLDDSAIGQGCVLEDPNVFKIYSNQTLIRFEDSEWDVSAQYAEGSILTAISYNQRRIYSCFANPTRPPPAESVNGTLKLVLSRKVKLPTNDPVIAKKIRQRVMAVFLIVKNLLNPNGPDPTYGDYKYKQKIKLVFYSETGNAIPDLAKTKLPDELLDSWEGYVGNVDIPKDATTLEIQFYTNDPYYAVGQISMVMLQVNPLYGHEAQQVVNVTFAIACLLSITVPVLLFLQDLRLSGWKLRKVRIPSLDIVRYQGPRYIRAVAYALIMASLYVTLKWLQAKEKSDPYETLPIFDGISSIEVSRGLKNFKSEHPDYQKLFRKSMIFFGTFVFVGFLFYPIFLCYGHAMNGHRHAAFLGVLVCLNLVIFRTCFEYISGSPLGYKQYARQYLAAVPEILAYLGVLVYFLMDGFKYNLFNTAFGRGKTLLQDVVYVRSLLRPLRGTEYFCNPGFCKKNDSRESSRGCCSYFKVKFMNFAAKVMGSNLLTIFKDNRPVWLREKHRLRKHIRVNIFNFFNYGRTPVRMATAIIMMCLFTYILLLSQLFAVLELNPAISCSLSLFGDSIAAAFQLIMPFLSAFASAQGFGGDLNTNFVRFTTAIQSETNGNVVDIFQTLILFSVFAAITFTTIILIYNICGLCLSYHQDITNLRAGRYERLKQPIENPYWRFAMKLTGYSEPSTALAMRFMGIQIGFAFMGSLYLMFVSMIVFFLLGMLFKFRAAFQLLFTVGTQNALIPTMLLIATFIVPVIQQCILETSLVAKIDTPYEKFPHGAEIDRPNDGIVSISTGFWLTRVNVYNQLDYLFLFPSLVEGLLKFLGNLISIMIRPALFAYRLDNTVHERSTVYFSWLLQEHHHSNPVVIVFTSCLFSKNNLPLGPDELRRRRIQQRWALAYTLVKNPQLARFRKEVVATTYLEDYIASRVAPVKREKEIEEMRKYGVLMGRGVLKDRQRAMSEAAKTRAKNGARVYFLRRRNFFEPPLPQQLPSPPNYQQPINVDVPAQSPMAHPIDTPNRTFASQAQGEVLSETSYLAPSSNENLTSSTSEISPVGITSSSSGFLVSSGNRNRP